ncbi:MAG: thymidylate synthase [candidate division KSB1 bacterium]|jgi:thymidylate synthase|nr:thymidylate synthase [candidate division KSB1 bacterium]
MQGLIPVLYAEGDGLAEAWENSLIEVHKHGCDIKTEYDKPGDPPSKDSSMTIVVRDPLSEPMIHKDFPGGLEDLQEYVLEVSDGIKDHCVRDSAEDADDTRWEYTYHQRLFAYEVPGLEKKFDQIEMIAEKLSKTPHTRRAQAITWQVWEDNYCYDPACLQSIWCRLLQGDDDQYYLNTNIRFRSNDAYKAAFMNMFAFIQLQKKIADRISELSGRSVALGRYVHQADSYHIYGSYFKEFDERFLNALDSRSFEERTFRYQDVKDIMEESIPAILRKAAQMGKKE